VTADVQLDETFDDEPFDVEAVSNGAWLPGPYGPGDQRGTFNEVTPEKTAKALSMLDLSSPVATYNLSEMLFPGFPAMAGRSYEQTLSIMGYQPPDDFEGILVTPDPVGPWAISSMEERVSMTYNMGTKINGLHHVGISGLFYNGFKGTDIARTWGTTALGNETQGPIVTRGVVVDIIGLKQATGRDEDLVDPGNGKQVLRDGYRITVEDIEAALEVEGITEPIGPGDVVLMRTGWREYIELDPTKYIEGLRPGPYLRECRYLAAKRPAIIGIDVWYFGGPFADMRGMLPHQELPVRYGVRIGEAVPTDVLVADGVYDFVFCFNPQNARGAISGSAPPIALAQPK
jgi:kynurenine formamidase